MEDDTIQNQVELIKTIEQMGWRVTATNMKEFDRGPGSDELMGVEIDLTVYLDLTDDDDNQNPYRVK